MAAPEENDKPSLPLSHYISWSHLLKKTFEIDTVCPRCKTPLRLIAMIETEDTIKKILSAMGLPTEGPKSALLDRLPRNLVARAEAC